jgi:hypothetical protein
MTCSSITGELEDSLDCYLVNIADLLGEFHEMLLRRVYWRDSESDHRCAKGFWTMDDE